MGNEVSQIEEDEFLNDAYDASLGLDSPDVDKHVNAGTTAANCQPKHTRKTQQTAEEGTEVGLNGNRAKVTESRKSERRKEQQDQKQKPSYIQMAKSGYQELVNAIIRPPRADYKVR